MLQGKLNIGENYPFTVIKHLPDPIAGGWFVLADPYGCKHLLTDEYYLNYGFEPGKSVICTVDKVNCKGKIFLEPEHPIYKPGDIAEFTFVEYASIFNKKRKKEIPVSYFTDEYGSKAVLMQQQKFSADKINFRISRIKKSTIFIEFP